MTNEDRLENARRRVAAEALTDNFSAAFSRGRPADRSLSEFFRTHRSCGGRDRAFISETVYAIWRNWGRLREKFPAERREAIERGEAFAAKEARALVCEASESSPTERAAILPAWVEAEVMEGFSLEDYAASIMKRPPMFLRLQCDAENAVRVREELAAAGLTVSEVEHFPRALAVSGKVNVFTLESYRRGLFEVQDISSQAIGLLCGAKRGERWWDACAGAGGKSLCLADCMERRGEVIASDVRAYKLDDLKKRARRAAFPNIRARAWDGKALRESKRGKFDGVLVDAPCSCSGVWRRNPDGMWTAHPEELPEMSELQRKILAAASTGVKQNGVLVYATCSMLKKENVEVTERFLAEHGDFVAETLKDPFSGEERPYLQFSPSRGGDAMFVCKMRRKS